MKSLLFGLCFFVLLSSTFAHGDDYTCNHDNEDYDVEVLNVEEDMSSINAGRVLQSEEYPKMRILASYDPLDSAPSSFKAYIQNELAPAVLDYLSSALRVKFPVIGTLQVSSSKVCDVRTPSELKAGVEADYFMIFDSRVEDSSTVASSKACQTASGTNRPLVGYTNFNRNMLIEARGDILLHEKNMYLLLHEIMHTLGVSKNSYDSYIDEFGKKRKGHIKSMKIGGTTHSVIDVPFLTERLRNYYNCPTLPGLIMENDGGSGTALSHLERKFWVYEALSSGGIFGRRVSEFSLGLLEASGWYKPDYSYAEPYFFGKGQGCDFINQKCSSNKASFDEFCTGSGRGCAPHGRGGGKCSSDSKSNGCKYIDPDTDYDCENPDGQDNARFAELEVYGRGADSKCFTGTLNARKSNNGLTSFCFKYECVGEGVNTQLQVILGNDRVVCDAPGQKSIDGYYGALNCPDPITFCAGVGKKYCPRNCMGRGTCGADFKCVCNEGFQGVDCGLKA